MSENKAKAAILRQMLDETEAALARLREKVQAQELLAAALRDKLATETSAVRDVERPDAEVANGEAHSVPEKIYRILKMNGAPMRASQLTAALAEMGVMTTSPKGLLPNVISGLTRRTDLFVKVSRGVYGLKEWHHGRANHPAEGK